MNVILRSLATLVLHGFGLGPGESHSEILANKSFFSRNVYLPFMSFTSRRTWDLHVQRLSVDFGSISPPFEPRTSSRDSLPLVSTCIIDGNEFLQLVAFVVYRLKRLTLGTAFARNERLANLIRIDLMLIKLVLICNISEIAGPRRRGKYIVH